MTPCRDRPLKPCDHDNDYDQDGDQHDYDRHNDQEHNRASEHHHNGRHPHTSEAGQEWRWSNNGPRRQAPTQELASKSKHNQTPSR